MLLDTVTSYTPQNETGLPYGMLDRNDILYPAFDRTRLVASPSSSPDWFQKSAFFTGSIPSSFASLTPSDRTHLTHTVGASFQTEELLADFARRTVVTFNYQAPEMAQAWSFITKTKGDCLSDTSGKLVHRSTAAVRLYEGASLLLVSDKRGRHTSSRFILTARMNDATRCQAFGGLYTKTSFYQNLATWRSIHTSMARKEIANSDDFLGRYMQLTILSTGLFNSNHLFLATPIVATPAVRAIVAQKDPKAAACLTEAIRLQGKARRKQLSPLVRFFMPQI